MKEKVPTIEDFYVDTLCNKPKYPFSKKDDVVKGQMIKVHYPNLDCSTWLGKSKGSVNRDLDTTIESYMAGV